jgi:hypothetical protein
MHIIQHFLLFTMHVMHLRLSMQQLHFAFHVLVFIGHSSILQPRSRWCFLMPWIAYTHRHRHKQTYIYIHSRTHTRTHTDLTHQAAIHPERALWHIHKHTRTHTHTHTHTHTDIYIDIHVHIQMWLTRQPSTLHVHLSMHKSTWPCSLCFLHVCMNVCMYEHA